MKETEKTFIDQNKLHSEQSDCCAEEDEEEEGRKRRRRRERDQSHRITVIDPALIDRSELTQEVLLTGLSVTL